MEKNNILDFKRFDPVKAGEKWAIDFGSEHEVVEIYIDGKKLIDIIREIEIPYAKEEGHPKLAGSYGHVSPVDLFDDLCMASDENSYSHKHGIYLFCCEECGEPGCWSVTCKMKEDTESVYWCDFKQEHREWIYDLTFKFEKTMYLQAVAKLKVMSLQ